MAAGRRHRGDPAPGITPEFSPHAGPLPQWRNEDLWAFTKSVRLKRYGRKRIVIVPERAELSDTPRFLVTNAVHWESSRSIETWAFRSEQGPFITQRLCNGDNPALRVKSGVCSFVVCVSRNAHRRRSP